MLGAGDIVESKLQNFFEIDVNSAPWSSVTKIMLGNWVQFNLKVFTQEINIFRKGHL